MTDTGGTPRPDDDTPTPSQGIPMTPGAPASGPTPPEPPAQAPATPPPGWESPTPAHNPGALPPYSAGGGVPPYPGQQPRWNPHGLGKPGVIALRPLNLGDILDGAITAIRRYPLLILGMSAIVAVVSTGLTLLSTQLLAPDSKTIASLGPGSTDQEIRDALFGLFGQLLLALVPALLITLLARTFLTGFLTVVMGKAVLGRPVDFGTAAREAAPRLFPLLGLTLLYGLAVVVCVLPIGLVFIHPALALIGIPATIVLAVMVFTYWSLASSALVLERGSILQAFSRSRLLVKGSFWRVFGILLLTGLIGSVISGIIQIPFGIGSGMFSGLFNPSARPTTPGTGALLLTGIGDVITQTLVTPFVSLVTVVLYIDQRMRREGMDIELARAAGMNPPPAPQAW